ncbi:hypothetical protein MBLNU13_g05299t1 [Cladosporium sp. NU13]
MASTISACISSTLGKVYNYLSPSPTQPPVPPKPSKSKDFAAILKASTNESSQQTFTLPDDRTLSFATYGASTGPIVFHLHGLGDSRLTGALFDQPGRTLGVRIIAVDRPGIGSSSPQRNRTALDHAEDIRLLAAHLGAKTYSVVGVSGGGPYALACAHALPAEELRSELVPVHARETLNAIAETCNDLVKSCWTTKENGELLPGIRVLTSGWKKRRIFAHRQSLDVWQHSLDLINGMAKSCRDLESPLPSGEVRREFATQEAYLRKFQDRSEDRWWYLNYVYNT